MLEAGHDYSRCCVSLWLLGRITARYPISANTAEQGLLVFPDPPHIVKVFRESEAHGVGEEVGEHSSEAREDTVGDEGGPVPVEILRERLREVAAHLPWQIVTFLSLKSRYYHPRRKYRSNS